MNINKHVYMKALGKKEIVLIVRFLYYTLVKYYMYGHTVQG